MKRTLTLLLALPAAVLVFALAANQQASAQDAVEPGLFRGTTGTGADTPSGRLMLRVPSTDGTGVPRAGIERPVEPPAEPTVTPPTEPELPPVCGIEIVGHNAIFVIDVSLSMAVKDVGSGEDADGNVISSMSRLEMVKAELIKLIRALPETFSFDIVWLAGHASAHPITDAWMDELVLCTDENREAAIEAVESQHMWFGTPSWNALKRACLNYTDEMCNYVFLSDGAPYPAGAGEWGSNHKEAIFSDFPAWYKGKKDYGCKLHCVHVGKNQNAGTFMQEFADQNDGGYTHR
ncbi:MAG: VWA domain-containing protein [Planctomycetes bacterium]|nr:VWA domain-containing protein [Planctomycetota bacterium]NUQ34352.1 VWA domain-containing protein [Planctomycetaceae bacterium]